MHAGNRICDFNTVWMKFFPSWKAHREAPRHLSCEKSVEEVGLIVYHHFHPGFGGGDHIQLGASFGNL